jgi:hypothetical protein
VACRPLRLTPPSEYRDIVDIANTFSQKVWYFGLGGWGLYRINAFLQASVVESHSSHNFPVKSSRTFKFLTTDLLRTCKLRALRLSVLVWVFVLIFLICCFMLIEFKCFSFWLETNIILLEQSSDTKRIRDNRQMVMQIPFF